jgi:hypothetical protein
VSHANVARVIEFIEGKTFADYSANVMLRSAVAMMERLLDEITA